MTGATWTPLWPEVERILRAAQPERFRWPAVNGSGWIGPLHSPLRDDGSPSFSVRPDSATDPGACVDHATGEHGSLADLARALGLDPRQTVRVGDAVLPVRPCPDSTPEPELTMTEFCRRRKLDLERLCSEWRVVEAEHDGRPALRFQTRLGLDRVKYLDGHRPKAAWLRRGGAAHWYGLPRALKHGGRQLLYLTNGEPSVWAAAQVGVPAVCLAAGEGKPTPELVAELVAVGVQSVRVVYDRDEAGRNGARKAVEALRAGGLGAVALELPADLGEHGDLDDLHRRTGDDGLAAALAALSELQAEAQAQADAGRVEAVETWPDRQPLPPDADPVPTLPADLLPDPLRPWLEDVASRASIPLECPAVPALVALGSVVGRTVAIRPEPRDDWAVVPNLWGGVVARPGFLKSAAIEAGLAPLGPLVAAARVEHIEASRVVEARRIVLESRLAATKRRKNGATEAEVGEILAELVACRVPEHRYLTNDGTPEKLGEILADNPRGILVARDELAGWLRTFDKPGREGEREFYLEGWNGTGSFTVDRIGRGTVHIPALCLSVVGSIQPGKLRAYVEDALTNGAGADGLLQRVQLLVWPDRLDVWKPVERWPDGEAKARAFATYAALDRLTADAVGAEPPEYGLPFLRFEPAAQALFLAWRTELERRLRGGELDACPAFEAHLAKYRSLMPSLALLFHLAGSVSSVSATGKASRNAVGLESAQRAAAWCEYLEAHARKLYAAELLPGRAAARALAEKLAAGAVTHRQTVRELYRPQWEGLKTPEAVAAGLGELERLGWLKVAQGDVGQSGGRPRAVVLLHPELRQRNGGAR